MAQDYKTFLAASVLNDNRTVSYRSLSRALKVHNNLAKQMLFEFHRQENSKKPNSVHATYLLSGIRQPQKPVTTNGYHEKDGDDVAMRSSPFMSSSMPQQNGEEEELIPTKSITLVAEENLEDAKALFEDLQSLHVYSLQPSPLLDLHVLTDVGREILTKYATEDPLEYGKTYGVIQNKNVKRRSGRRPPPTQVAAPPTEPAPRAKSARPKETKEEATSNDDTSRPSSRSDEKKDLQGPKIQKTSVPQRQNSETSKKVPTMKRDKSDIFKSFAKSKPKLKREDTDSSAVESAADSAEPSGLEDTDMKDPSEEEEDDEHYLDKVKKSAPTEPTKSRIQREEELRKMMDDDDEPMADSQDAVPSDVEPMDANVSQETEKFEPEEPAVTVPGGRRRGRRQIKKKRTVKDEDGYLVTNEELVWESFSEDEPALSKAKPSSQASSGFSKGGKTAPKPAQGKSGNIMSFFSKK